MRALKTSLLTLALLAITAPAALAHDGGEGWWGETNDKVITNAGFILIAFFPLFILVMSLHPVAAGEAQGRAQARPRRPAPPAPTCAAAGSAQLPALLRV